MQGLQSALCLTVYPNILSQTIETTSLARAILHSHTSGMRLIHGDIDTNICLRVLRGEE